jgi:hypothetical protein
MGLHEFAAVFGTSRGVQISVKMGKIAAGDFCAQTMAGQENVAGRANFELNFVDASRRKNSGCVEELRKRNR